MLMLKVFISLNLYVVLANESWNFDGQNKYEAILERAEIVWKNDAVIKDISVRTFRYNRTIIAASGHCSVYVNIESFKVQVLLYKFSVNQYKRTAMQGTFDLCQVLKYNFFGVGRLLKESGNVTDCPVKKGTYVIHNGIMDSSRFPPNLPEGRAMINVIPLINGQKACSLNVYVEIKYGIKNRKH